MGTRRVSEGEASVDSEVRSLAYASGFHFSRFGRLPARR